MVIAVGAKGSKTKTNLNRTLVALSINDSETDSSAKTGVLTTKTE
jgi:hypothetical protein